PSTRGSRSASRGARLITGRGCRNPSAPSAASVTRTSAGSSTTPATFPTSCAARSRSRSSTLKILATKTSPASCSACGRPSARRAANGSWHSTSNRSGQPSVDDDEFLEACGELVGIHGVALACPRRERRRLDFLVAPCERTAPRLEVDHGAIVVSEVPEQPPQPLGSAHVPVRNDEGVVPDSRLPCSVGELLRVG